MTDISAEEHESHKTSLNLPETSLRRFRIQREPLLESAQDAARLSEVRFKARTTDYIEVLTNETNHFSATMEIHMWPTIRHSVGKLLKEEPLFYARRRDLVIAAKRGLDTIGLRPAEPGGDHSWRKARMGSTRMARRAGT